MSAAVRTGSCLTGRRRVARKQHACDDCNRAIRPGDVYLESTSFPGHDSGYASFAGHPVRMLACARCATRYGHEHLLDLIPFEQCARDGLL